VSHVIIDRGHAVEVFARPIGQADATTIANTLGRAGIGVESTVDAVGTVTLWPLRRLTTAEEVVVLQAYTAVTDSRLAWHQVATV
jgi:hypothetical protein